jgi:nucleoside-diphosphate-sugar epimerase
MEFKLAALKKLEETPSLQHTRFINGTFMDYLSTPSSAIPSNMRLISLFLDVHNNRAVIPGSGDVPAVFTHSSDVGKFVAAALDLVEWPEKSVIIGEKITLNSLVSVVEKIKGTSPIPK